MAHFSGQVIAADGTVIQASGDATVTQPPASILIGASMPSGSASVSAHVALFPQMQGGSRVFASTGAGFPSWTSATINAMPSTWIPHVSFKDMPTTQAAWVSYLTSAPSRFREVWVTYHHEPEGDLPAATFKQQWQQLIAWAAAIPNRTQVKLIPVFTWYAEVHKGYNWADFWPGAGADAIGWDLYPTGTSNWLAASSLCQLPLQSATTAGVPLVVSELGVVLPASFTLADQQARAAWMTSVVSTLRAGGARSCAWWCNTGGQGNFHLDNDQPGLAAWNAAIAGH